MIQSRCTNWYATVCLIVFMLDRVTKFYAVRYWATEYMLAPSISFQLTYNRGISWGIGNSGNYLHYFLITALIIAITCLLIAYTYRQWRSGNAIWGELLVITGSLSNIIDRFVYGGVVDFIMLYWRQYTFPIFNIADIAIVIGVGIMFLQLNHERARE